jgi:hypothetical protein
MVTMSIIGWEEDRVPGLINVGNQKIIMLLHISLKIVVAIHVEVNHHFVVN